MNPDTPPPKPLIIEARPGMQIELDGPALRITTPHRAERLFPLARLSRILTIGHAEWQTRALLACAEQGIPLAFSATDGQLLARLLGPRTGRLDLPQRLHDFLQRPDWRPRYADWRHGIDQQSLHHHRRILGLPPHLRDPESARHWLWDQYRRLAGPRHAPSLMNHANSLLLSRCQTQLLAFGLDADTAANRHAHLDLAQDLTAALHWPAAVPLLTHLRNRRHSHRGKKPRQAPPPVPLRKLCALLEQHTQPLDDHCRSLIERLYLYLIELD